MAQTTINVRIDENTKHQLEKFCDETGFTISSLFNVFSKTVVREQRIPFEIQLDPFFSKTNMEAIKKSIKEINEGKTVVKTIEELEKMENE